MYQGKIPALFLVVIKRKKIKQLLYIYWMDRISDGWKQIHRAHDSSYASLKRVKSLLTCSRRSTIRSLQQ